MTSRLLGSWTGAKYWISSLPPSHGTRKELETSCPSDTGCNPQKPDLLSLEDGQKYDIAGLDDRDLESLLEYAYNGTSAEGIPEMYKVLAIKE